MNKRKISHFTPPESAKQMVLGAVAGSIVGAGTALLLAPKSGEDLREDINDTYQDLKEDFKEGIIQQGENLMKNSGWSSKSSSSNTNILIGGIAGGILCAAAVYLLTQKSRKSSGLISEDFKERAGSFINGAKSVLSNVVETLDEGEERIQKASSNSNVDDIVELVTIGLKLFQSFKNRR